MKNLRRLACKFDLDQSEHKSSQVNTSARKAWPKIAAFNLRRVGSPFDQGLINLAVTCFDLLSLFNVQSTEVISESLLATYQRLSEIPDPKLPVKYPRTPGYRPSGKDNPCNAW